MNTRQIEDRLEAISENTFVKFGARFGMSLATPLIIAASLWLGGTLWGLNEALVRLTAEFNGFKAAVALGTADRYTSTSAAKDFAVKDQKDDAQDMRLNRHDIRLDRLESKAFEE